MYKKYLSFVLGLAMIFGFAVAAPALAQTTSLQAGWQGRGGPMMGRGNPSGAMMKPGVFGTVSAINGNILTVTSKGGLGGPRPMTSGKTSVAPTAPTPVTYTVDATNATVMKNNATSTLSAIVVGDSIVAQGTLTGTNFVATTIRDGLPTMMGGGKGQNGNDNGNGDGKGHATSTPLFVGNGQPIVAGNVSVINGSSITVTNKSNVTYTVDASSAKILSGQNSAATIANIAVGDSVVVQGTVNGTAVTATTILDQAKPATTPKKGMMGNFFGGIGSFFGHLFGF